MKGLAYVIRNQLCTGCGTCAGICPADAIKMQISDAHDLFLPRIDEEKCAKCGLCIKCCAGHRVDLQKLGSDTFGGQSNDARIGNWLECYLGYSNDPEIRYNSSSGGIVTHLLLFALEKGIIDGALVTRMRKDKPLQPEPFIARTRSEILEATGSKYCPVPLSMGLKQILAQEGKYAVVGLPCHMHGIRLAEAYSRKLKDRIVLHIGLLCCHTTDFIGTDFILKRFRVEANEVSHLDYRGSGWPGSMSVSLRDGRNVKIRFMKEWNAYMNILSSFFFTPIRCITCPDQSNEFCDIAAGDAWLKELRGDRIGTSVVIARTEAARVLLESMRRDGGISIMAISPSKMKESQGFSLNFKKENIGGRLSLLKMLGRSVPQINPTPRPNSLAWFAALLPYMSIQASSSKTLRSILSYVPLPILRLYFGLYKCFFFMSRQRRPA